MLKKETKVNSQCAIAKLDEIIIAEKMKKKKMKMRELRINVTPVLSEITQSTIVKRREAHKEKILEK